LRPYLKKTHYKKRAGGVAQGVGPEFKSQYCKKIPSFGNVGISQCPQALCADMIVGEKGKKYLSFNEVGNIHVIKFTLLTILKYTVQWC
jgi:hypothetical protein